jgi:NAD(P)-dependent dehydrogenase (short-subunit alcohol dehydrogenase family)
MNSVLITGASSGIGAATALMLDRQGMRVFAGVESDADGREQLAS